MRSRVFLISLVTLVTLLAGAGRGFAQGWSSDARKIALGGVGTNLNIASQMIEPDPKYRSIFIPLGLLQIVSNFDKFNPNSSNFDPIRAMEYVANPYHFTIGRNDDSAGRKLATDLFNGNVHANLNDYRGFIPPKNPKTEGIASFSLIHKTFKFQSNGTQFQGIYVGVGPYLTHRTSIDIDQKILDILSATDAPVSFPNDQYLIQVDRSTTQVAGAITFGYRGHMGNPPGLPSEGRDREGLYVAVNYNYLHGFRLFDEGVKVRFDTGPTGSLFLNPNKVLAPCPAAVNPVGFPAGTYGTPFCTDHRYSTSGTGRAIDFGVASVFGKWEVGFGINGLSSYIEWSDVEQSSFQLAPNIGLTSGASFDLQQTPTVTLANKVKIEQPTDVRANATYHAFFGTLMADIGNGYQGTSIHSGIEKKFGPLAGRAGMRYTNEKWNPSLGAGITFLPRVGLDFAYLTSTANAEKTRQSVMALSLRINSKS